MDQNINLSKCTLLNLNNDCLMELFKYLNWIDSFNFCASCRNAGIAGRNKFKEFVEFKWPHHGRKELDYFDIEPIFNVIGPNIVSLCISGATTNDMITILDNCTQLESLKLTYCAISYDFLLSSDWRLEELKLDHCFLDDNVCWSGLNKLKHLEITGSSMLRGHLDQLLENNVNIEILKLSGVFEFNYLLLQKLEKLHVLRIGLHENWILDVVSYLFQLKKIEINCWSYKNMNEFIYNIVVNCSLEELILEKLCFDSVTYTILQSTKFRSLTLINPEFYQLQYNLDILTPALRSTMSNAVELKLTLNCLCLSPDQMFNFIGQMKCLEYLNLYECNTNFHHFLKNRWETTDVNNILHRIDKVLKKQKRKSALTLIMPKRMMFLFGREFEVEMYSINPLRLKIPKPTDYDADFQYMSRYNIL